MSQERNEALSRMVGALDGITDDLFERLFGVQKSFVVDRINSAESMISQIERGDLKTDHVRYLISEVEKIQSELVALAAKVHVGLTRNTVIGEC